MSENTITITNPLKFWNKKYILEKLNFYGFGDENTIQIKIITYNEMPEEVEIKFLFPEFAQKFLKIFNNKPIDELINHQLIIHSGPSNKTNKLTSTKKAIYYDNYTYVSLLLYRV